MIPAYNVVLRAFQKGFYFLYPEKHRLTHFVSTSISFLFDAELILSYARHPLSSIPIRSGWFGLIRTYND